MDTLSTLCQMTSLCVTLCYVQQGAAQIGLAAKRGVGVADLRGVAGVNGHVKLRYITLYNVTLCCFTLYHPTRTINIRVRVPGRGGRGRGKKNKLVFRSRSKHANPRRLLASPPPTHAHRGAQVSERVRQAGVRRLVGEQPHLDGELGGQGNRGGGGGEEGKGELAFGDRSA